MVQQCDLNLAGFDLLAGEDGSRRHGGMSLLNLSWKTEEGGKSYEANGALLVLMNGDDGVMKMVM